MSIKTGEWPHSPGHPPTAALPWGARQPHPQLLSSLLPQQQRAARRKRAKFLLEDAIPSVSPSLPPLCDHPGLRQLRGTPLAPSVGLPERFLRAGRAPVPLPGVGRCSVLGLLPGGRGRERGVPGQGMMMPGPRAASLRSAGVRAAVFVVQSDFTSAWSTNHHLASIFDFTLDEIQSLKRSVRAWAAKGGWFKLSSLRQGWKTSGCRCMWDASRGTWGGWGPWCRLYWAGANAASRPQCQLGTDVPIRRGLHRCHQHLGLGHHEPLLRVQVRAVSSRPLPEGSRWHSQGDKGLPLSPHSTPVSWHRDVPPRGAFPPAP